MRRMKMMMTTMMTMMMMMMMMMMMKKKKHFQPNRQREGRPGAHSMNGAGAEEEQEVRVWS